jgi:hypothetical protein
MKRPDASSLRKEYVHLCEEATRLREVFCAYSPLWRGTVYTLRTRCGRANCHCAEGELHEAIVLGDRSEETHHTITLRIGERKSLRRMTEAYRRVRKARSQLLAIHKAMLKTIDRLTEIRLQEGRRRAPPRLAKKKGKRRR